MLYFIKQRGRVGVGEWLRCCRRHSLCPPPPPLCLDVSQSNVTRLNWQLMPGRWGDSMHSAMQDSISRCSTYGLERGSLNWILWVACPCLRVARASLLTELQSSQWVLGNVLKEDFWEYSYSTGLCQGTKRLAELKVMTNSKLEPKKH